jgi:hypothetical protein
MRKVAVLFAAVILSGCANLNYVMENYNGIEPVNFAVAGADEYRVFDKPDQNRMMISSSLSSAMGQGAAAGLTLGAVDATPAKPLFQRAAEEYLASTGRSCTIVDGYLLIKPQWEFKYSCSPPLAQRPVGKRVRS